MARSFLSIFLFLLPLFVWSQSSPAVLVLGSDTTDRIEDFVIDAQGNYYVVGTHLDSVDFDPGPADFSLPNMSFGPSVFIAKYDSTLNLIWAKSFLSTAFFPLVNIDGVGGVYLTGIHFGTIDLDPGPGTDIRTSSGSGAAFIVKLDTAGTYQWGGAQGVSGSMSTNITDLDFDANGNLLLLGNIGSTYGMGISADVDPFAGIDSVSSTNFATGMITRISPSGSYLGTSTLGNGIMEFTSFQNHGTGLLVSMNYRGIDTFGSLSVNTGTGTAGILLKLDSTDQVVWARILDRMNTFEHSSIDAFDVDANGDIVVGGWIRGTVDLDPGPGTFFLSSSGIYDAYCMRMNAAGNLLWAHKLSGINPASTSGCEDLALDGNGNAFLVGRFRDAYDFSSGSSPNVISPVGNFDIFVQQINPSGQAVGIATYGGPEYDQPHRIQVDAGNGIHLAGEFKDTVDFDPTANVLNAASHGAADGFLIGKMLLPTCLPTTDSIFPTLSICDGSYMAPSGQILNSTGTYTDIIPNAAGCDSTITIFLTVPQFSDSTVIVSTCGPYVGPSGQIWDSTGTYLDTLVNAQGCDSVITTQLVITPLSSTVNASTCDQYIGPSGQIWDTAGTYVDTLTNAQGCDSIVTVNLQIDTVSAQIVQNSSYLGVLGNGINFQWLDCNNNYAPISGATGNIFIPTSTGSYAVAVDNNLCSDTTDCVPFVVIGLEGSLGLQGVQVSPNPSSSWFKLQFPSPQAEVELSLTDVMGKECGKWKLKDVERFDFQIPGASGIYHLHIRNAESRTTLTLLKR